MDLPTKTLCQKLGGPPESWGVRTSDPPVVAPLRAVTTFRLRSVALMICKLQRILKGFTSLVAQRVFFDDADNAICKSKVSLPYSVLPFAERTIFSFGCKRTIGALIHACNTTIKYGFVLHCCDVMALCTAS